VVNRIKQLATLAYVVAVGEKKLGMMGHTLLQKLFYLLQHGEGVNLGYKFKLHYYGPYCEDLWSDLNYLDDQNVVKVIPSESGYGYEITSGSASDDILKRFDSSLAPKIEKMLDLLGNEPVRRLEALATTHFVYRELQNRGQAGEQSLVVKKVLSLKPHLSTTVIEESLQILQDNRLLK